MPVTKEDYGHTASNRLVEQFVISNESGMVAKVINYGAALTELWVPDKHNMAADVVLGWPDIKGYQNNTPYLGVTVGRVANRIGQGKFHLNGVDYQMDINNGPNHIHGGILGFSNRVWESSIQGNDEIKLTYVSPDGEEGYPGEVSTSVCYSLTDDDRLIISYTATATRPTPLNLTNHSYFNLAGHAAGSILDHYIQIDADHYTPMDIPTSLPTGEIAPVHNTVLDLRQPVRIGDRIYDVPGLGFDHNFCVKSRGETCARVAHKESGRNMEVVTTSPGIQLYTANYLNDTTVGKGGNTYPKHSALCLETQYYPNAVNQPNFPSCILNPGQNYMHTTVYKFSWN